MINIIYFSETDFCKIAAQPCLNPYKTQKTTSNFHSIISIIFQVVQYS